MEKVIIESLGKIALVRLVNSENNAIDIETVADFDKAVDEVKRHFKAVVIAGGDRFFSIGFNLPLLINYDVEEIKKFFFSFNQLVLKLYTMPLPTCAALKGHAVAGGCILALPCDFIFGASGKKFIGLNEIKLGLPVPYLSDLILRQRVSDSVANELLYMGDFITHEQAKAVGLLSEVCLPEEVEKEAVNKVSKISEYGKDAFSAIKQARQELIVDRYLKHGKEMDQKFIDCWLREETLSLLKEAVKKF